MVLARNLMLWIKNISLQWRKSLFIFENYFPKYIIFWKSQLAPTTFHSTHLNYLSVKIIIIEWNKLFTNIQKIRIYGFRNSVFSEYVLIKKQFFGNCFGDIVIQTNNCDQNSEIPNWLSQSVVRRIVLLGNCVRNFTTISWDLHLFGIVLQIPEQSTGISAWCCCDWELIPNRVFFVHIQFSRNYSLDSPQIWRNSLWMLLIATLSLTVNQFWLIQHSFIPRGFLLNYGSSNHHSTDSPSSLNQLASEGPGNLYGGELVADRSCPRGSWFRKEVAVQRAVQSGHYWSWKVELWRKETKLGRFNNRQFEMQIFGSAGDSIHWKQWVLDSTTHKINLKVFNTNYVYLDLIN